MRRYVRLLLEKQRIAVLLHYLTRSTSTSIVNLSPSRKECMTKFNTKWRFLYKRKKKHSGKEQRLDTLLAEIVARGEKVIVWSSFIENVNYFYAKYKSLISVRIHGGMTIEDRNKSVEKFKSGEANVLFATPQAAKEGLTLTIANNVIFYDRGFNLDDYLQAQDRIHRISQTKTCFVYNLMIKDSIDVWVDKLLQAKQNAAFLAQGDYKLAQYQSIMDYSYGELIKEILNMEEQ